MATSSNFDNGVERFNIHLDAQGNLNFNANNTDGNGDTRVSISDDTGIVIIGGSGQFGGLQLTDPSNGNTLFLGASATEATALLGGGGSEKNGIVKLGNSQGLTTIDMQGGGGNVFLGADPSGTTSGQDGDLWIRDGSGGVSIKLTGDTGNCECVSLTETSDLRLKKGIAPLVNALDKVLALRGVCYQWKQEDSPKKAFSEKSQIGFVGQEMETVCPELVSTDSEGYKSLNYSRLTPILVEAIKEQQQLIQQQASALGEALEKMAQIETTLKMQSA